MDWQQYFSSSILERGYDYYKNDLVEISSVSHDAIDANVEGTSYYSLRVSFDGDNLKSMFCDCPYEGNCKHLAALLYYVDDHPEILSESENLKDFIDTVSYEELKEFVLMQSLNNSDFFNRLKIFAKSEIDDDYYIGKLKNSFSKSINVIKFMDDDLALLVDYRKCDLVIRLCNIIIPYLEDLYDNGQWDAFDYILDRMDTVMMRLFDMGFEDEALDFLENIILNNDNTDILDMLTDTYSRIGDVEKLFDEHFTKV